MTGVPAEVGLPAGLCLLDHDAADAESALRALSARALELGHVREGHADALVAREREHPTGLPMPVPLAIPHTDAHWVLRPTLAALVPREPIPFRVMGSPSGAGDTVGARLVLMLAVADPAQQVPLLGRLLGALRRPDLDAVLLGGPHGLDGPDDLAARFAGLLDG